MQSPLLEKQKSQSWFTFRNVFCGLGLLALTLVAVHGNGTSEFSLGMTPGSPTPMSPSPTSPKAPSPAAAASSGSATTQEQRVVVVGSINVDLYLKLAPDSTLLMDKQKIDISSVKGMTLPSEAFLGMDEITTQLTSKKLQASEDLVFKISGDFEQKTGGKGANAAAAAGQTFRCEFIGQMGAESSKENQMLYQDLANYGAVQVNRVVMKPNIRTGTAYIFLYPDNDNSILLIGGANMAWPQVPELETNGLFTTGLQGAVAVMLQREIPNYVNLYAAKTANAMGIPVMMDVGGTNEPLDETLIPYLSLVVPNESELTFISGVETTVAGNIDKTLLRKAVAKLKELFASKGNSNVEVLVTLGSCGSLFFETQWSMSAQPEDPTTGLLPFETYVGCFPLETPNKKPVDTTGAGDCYRGSFVAARFGEKKSILESMQWAASASSLAVEGKGAMPSMPTRVAIEQRISKGKTQFGENLNLGTWK